MAHDVFISCSVKDKPTADAICATLEGRRIRCWMAPRDIMPSADWAESIADAIEQSRVLILVFSADSNQSPQVKREVQNGVEAGIAILPFRIEDIRPSGTMRYFLGTQHWLDALTPPLEAHLQRLADTVLAILGRAPDAEAGREAAPLPPTPRGEAGSAQALPASSAGEQSLRQLAEMAWLDGALTEQERAFLLERAKQIGVETERAEHILVEARPQEVHVPQPRAAPVPVQPSPHRAGDAADGAAGTLAAAAPAASTAGEKAAAVVSPPKPVAPPALKPKDTPASAPAPAPGATVATSKGTAAAPPAPAAQVLSGVAVSDATLRLQLRATDGRLKGEVIREIVRRGLSDAAEDLKDVMWTDQFATNEARTALDQLGVKLSTDELLEHLHSQAERARVAAILYVNTHGSREFVDELRGLAANDESRVVRGCAMSALNSLGIDTPLQELRERFRGADGFIRYQAVLEIRRRDLREFANELQTTAFTAPTTGSIDLQLLERWGKSVSPEQLHEYLATGSLTARMAAVNDIGRRDLREFRHELTEIALSNTDAIRTIAQQTLQKWSEWGPALREVLRDKSRPWAVRRQTVDEITKAGASECADDFAAVAADAEDNAEVRTAVIRALSQAGFETPPDDLRKRLSDKDARIRESAVREIGKRELRALADQLETVADSDPDLGLRQLAGGLLSKWGLAG